MSLSRSQRPWPTSRRANDGGQLFVAAFPCRNEHWAQSTTDRIYGMVKKVVHDLGARPLVIQYDPINQFLLLVADTFNPTISIQSILDAILDRVNSPTTYLAYHSHRPFGIDSVTRRYLGPLLPYTACLTLYSRDHLDAEQMDRAVVDSYPTLRKLAKQARRTHTAQAHIRYLVTLGRHGAGEMYGTVVETVNSALRKVCRRQGWTLVLSSCQPDHLHCVVETSSEISMEDLGRKLRGGISKIMLAECPWTRRYAGGVWICFWDRNPEVRSAAVAGDHWKTLELYLRGQSARHGRRVHAPKDQLSTPVHRTSRLMYGKPLRRKEQRTPRSYFQNGKGSKRQV